MKPVKFNDVEDKIFSLQGIQVILDSDVAVLYDVETKRVNEAVKNNPEKFPEGYVLELTAKEWRRMKSKFSTSFSLSAGGKVKIPKVFTEKGLYMLATILKSPQATQTTIAIVETFAKIRELSRTVVELSEAPEESQQKSLMQRSGDIISDILGSDVTITDTETTIELNFAVMKFKHTVKRKTEKPE